MLERYILHVTTNTGHRRRSFRSEVADSVVNTLRPLVERAIAGERVEIPQLDGYTMTAERHGWCLLVTLWGRSPSSDDPLPILTTGVAPRSRCGARLWRRLHETATPLATGTDWTPPPPWVADRIEAGSALHLDAMHWTGDFARCIAWTWMDMREGDEADDA